MSPPAPAPPVCALCRKRPGVTRLPPSPLLLGERWHCDADRCVRLANSGEPIFTMRPSMVEQIRHALKEPRR